MPSRIHSSEMLPEQRKRLSPDFLANEDAYWNNRETLIQDIMENVKKWRCLDEIGRRDVHCPGMAGV